MDRPEELGQTRVVTSRQLGQLVALVPVMIHWLRDGGPESSALIVKDTSNTDNNNAAVQALLNRLVDAFNFSGDLTIEQVRELGESAGEMVWASAIRKIVLDSEPSLIPATVGVDLVKAETESASIKQALDKLTRTHYYALAELCSLFNDCGDPEATALAGSRLVVHSSHDGSSESSTRVMRKIISECGTLFGRAAGADVPRRGLGGDKVRGSNLAQAQLLPVVSVQDSLLNARKHALRAFFQWKEESKVEAVDLLFENHSFVNIARGIWERYEVLPGGWRGELEELRNAGVAEAQWVPIEGQPLPSSTTESSVPGILEQSANNNVVSSKTARRTLAGLVRVSRTGPMAEGTPSPQFSNLQLLINEIVDSEVFYYSILKELQDVYVSQLREIAGGAKGADAQAALGISLNDVEMVFGWRLAQVVETSKNLLSRLEVINLVRHEVKHQGGRAWFVASAFAAIAPNLSVTYAPFVSGHRHGMNVLNGRSGLGGNRPYSTKEARPISTRFSTLGSRFSSRNLITLVKEGVTSSSSGQNSFLSIWDATTLTSKKLKGQSLQSIMIMPIQRIPRYKLLLAELEKKLTPEHPAVPMLTTALSQVSHVAQQINQALRQHEKLENLVGASDMPEIAGAKNTVRNGAVRLTVNYKASNAS